MREELINGKKLNKYIDHTLLKPEARAEDIKRLCEEAIAYNFYSVCVNSCYTELAASLLDGTDVKICTVVGFPLGACQGEAKAFETSLACRAGAREIDMVINVGLLKDGKDELVIADILQVVRAAKEYDASIKVIMEIGLLTDDELLRGCILAKEAGASFVKTSTGYIAGGATTEAVSLMRKAVGDKMGVKASGGIRDYKTAIAMIEAGASRLGTSSSVNIVSERNSL